jgi:hypothetical protein
MCSAIEDGRQTERQSEQSFDLLKKVGEFKFIEMVSEGFTHIIVEAPAAWPVFLFEFPTRSEVPPTPPPLA